MAEKVTALVPAAGTGVRMGGDEPKQFLRLGGRPLLLRTLAVIERVPRLDEVVVMVPAGREQAVRRLIAEGLRPRRPHRVITGGSTRQQSVARGAEAAERGGASWVLVHDAARPLAPARLFSRVLAAARQGVAAVAAAPCYDTVKESADGELVSATLERGRLWLVQTPQAFRLAELRRVQELAAARGFEATDEAGLMEWRGHPVRLVQAPRHNFKLTTPEDLRLARGWLEQGEDRMGGIALGQGMDVHRLVPGRPLVLAGVEIPFELGLEGHSDADVLTHAVMDALLAAAGLGDIGGMFPDSDPAYAGASSLELLDRVLEGLARAGWRPGQVSVTVVAQRPRLAPHMPAMRRKLARRLGLAPERVNLAATTSEGLGFTGRGQGMAATALALLRPLGAGPGGSDRA